MMAGGQHLPPAQWLSPSPAVLARDVPSTTSRPDGLIARRTYWPFEPALSPSWWPCPLWGRRTSQATVWGPNRSLPASRGSERVRG